MVNNQTDYVKRPCKGCADLGINRYASGDGFYHCKLCLITGLVIGSFGSDETDEPYEIKENCHSNYRIKKEESPDIQQI